MIVHHPVKPVRLAEKPDSALAFQSARCAADFMEARGEEDWEYLLVSSSMFAQLIPSLWKQGFRDILLDPEKDGGRTFSLDQTAVRLEAYA